MSEVKDRGKYIYVASSWRNPWQPAVVALLREYGFDCYDFRHPEPVGFGFRWTDVDPDWKLWDSRAYRQALQHPVAQHGFALDMEALRRSAVCLLVQPCGNSAHLELGWAVGAGKRTAVLYPHGLWPVPIGGHSVSGMSCGPCGDLDGCWLPGKLHQVVPELMIKMADDILCSAEELRKWIETL